MQAGQWNYAQHFTFNAAGAVTSLQLGNNRWESTQFNTRLQPTQIALGTVQNGTDKLDLDFGYGTTANNGNVLSQTITVPTVGSYTGFTATQTYTYDSVNRIKDATENITGQTPPSWKQTFTYDRYGNRNFDQANTTQPASFADPDVTNPTISTTNNRFASGQGYSYDSAGNTTQDALGRTFIYDAENKQIEVIENSVTIGEYFYDGDGKRVKKIVPNGETVIFVYDAAGKLVAEYANQISQTPKVSYLTSDHLGSPRINTDENGAVIARHDYHPFGEEVSRTGYGSDTIRKQFTGYERDTETGLDFAQARYLNSGFGRFSSPDDFLNDTTSSNPQTWNLYAYVTNNPLRYVDPSGKIIEEKDGKVKTRDRNDEDSQMVRINGKNYFLPTGQKVNIGGKDYMITWEAKKVWVFADNGDRIKAYQSKGDIQLIQLKTDDSGRIGVDKVLDSRQSKGLVEGLVSSSDLPLSNQTNCHGTTFAKGQVWIDNLEVGKVLAGDKYRAIGNDEKAQANDVGVYSEDNGIGGRYDAHSVRVNSVGENGVVDVVSKGGITRQQTLSPGAAWSGDGTTRLQYWTKRNK